MKLKAGVTKQGVQGPIWYAVGCAEMIYRLQGLNLTVTSLTDSHADKPNSLHNRGMAVDLRTRGLDGAMLHQLTASIKNVLDPHGFDIVLETDHIHIEYDPKPGEAWHETEIA